ncbi:MAG TPA: SDR family oxidoreductase [Pyrinomonadaceae bacterium]
MKLKKVSQQTIVITGATSGIGLTTARMAARKGARLVLIARNEEALRQLADELNSKNTEAIYFAADVADENALQNAADAAIAKFGGFDTWVNNAGVSIYGEILETQLEDMRRLFDTNFWGVVNGSRVAAQHLKNRGGALINVGSVLSDRAISIQGVYSASKHAVKGFTDALRMELESENYPISVTLIKPSAINTPYTEHARNLMSREPNVPPPVYAPELVAEAILFCAQNVVRDFTVGEGGKMISLMGNLAPRLTDKAMEWSAAATQQKASPDLGNRPDSLYETHSDLRERGNYDGIVFEESLYQRAKLNPLLTSAILIGGAAALVAVVAGKSNRERNGDEVNHRNLQNEQPRSLEVGHS